MDSEATTEPLDSERPTGVLLRWTMDGPRRPTPAPPITPPLTPVWWSRISFQEEVENQVIYPMTRCTFVNMLTPQRRQRLRTTSPDYTLTGETYTMTNQGSVMAVNIEGWSANDEPEPEEEEVSIFVSPSDPMPCLQEDQ